LIRENTEDPTADLKAINKDQVAEYFESIGIEDIKKSSLFLVDKCSKSEFNQFNGTVMEWFIIEITIYCFFLVAMLLLMIKSRFVNIGHDNSDQFESLRISIIINKAIYKAIQDDEKRFHSKKSMEKYYIDKERIILTEQVPLKVFLSEKDFKMVMDNKPVPQDEADEWLVRCVVGNIYKDDLDNERTNEINSLDLMQNATVFSHTESVMEV